MRREIDCTKREANKLLLNKSLDNRRSLTVINAASKKVDLTFAKTTTPQRDGDCSLRLQTLSDSKLRLNRMVNSNLPEVATVLIESPIEIEINFLDIVESQMPMQLIDFDSDELVMNYNLLDIIESPSSMQLSDFESNISAALLLYYENSGLDRFRKNTSIQGHLPEDLSTYYEEIGCGISSETKNECIKSFQSKLNYASPLLSCGVCGVRKFTTEMGSNYNLNNAMLDVLKLTLDAVVKHDSLGYYKSMCSIFTDPNDDKKRFYLHPELIDRTATNTYEVYVCFVCVNALKKKLYQNIPLRMDMTLGESNVYQN